MANNKNKSAFNQMKFEVAKELGIDLKKAIMATKQHAKTVPLAVV